MKLGKTYIEVVEINKTLNSRRLWTILQVLPDDKYLCIEKDSQRIEIKKLIGNKEYL